jgi:hypothetical protein
MTAFSSAQEFMTASLVAVAILTSSSWSLAQDPPGPAVVELKKWLATDSYGRGWHAFLKLDTLDEQLARGSAADPGQIREILSKFTSGQPGLEKPRFVRVRMALAQWLSDLDRRQPSDLPAWLRQRKLEIKPPSEIEVAAARTQLSASMASLAGWLRKSGQSGKDWFDYMNWTVLEAQAAQVMPDLSALEPIALKLHADESGLELPRFCQVRRDLDHFMRSVRGRLDTDALAVQSQVEKLASAIEAWCQGPTTSATSAITSAMAELHKTGQGEEICREVRRAFSHGNVRIEVSEELLSAAMGGPRTDVSPLRELILGTDVRGTGYTQGTVAIEVVPSDSRAALNAVFTGTTASKTVGYNGPAVIYSDGTTTFTATKRLWLDATGLTAEPARSVARTSTITRGIGANRGGMMGKLVQRVASKKVSQSKSEAERISSRRAELRVNAKMDQESGAMLAKANRLLRERLRAPLARRDAFPEVLLFHTTDEAMRIYGRVATARRLAAPTAAPEVVADPALVVQFHDSAINNMMADAFAGRTIANHQLEELAIELFGKVPDRFVEEDAEPWSITFADDEPVTVYVKDGVLELTIRAAGFTSADKSHQAMNIGVSYVIERTPTGLRLARQGDLVIVPPDFDPSTSEGLPLKVKVLQQRLQKKLAKVFDAELVVNEIELPGKMAAYGKLGLAQLDASGGWLTVAWMKSSAAVAEKKGRQPLVVASD